MFLKRKTEQSTRDSWRDLPNGYQETIRRGINAVRNMNGGLAYGKGTRSEQIARLKEEIETADAIVIGAGA